jgi:hypothetical protein
MIGHFLSGRAAARVREHEAIDRAVKTLSVEYPHCTVGELYDALITARQDLGKARRLANEARDAGMQLGAYLALFESVEAK